MRRKLMASAMALLMAGSLVACGGGAKQDGYEGESKRKKLHLNTQTQLKTKNKESKKLSCWLMEMGAIQNRISRLIWCNSQH